MTVNEWLGLIALAATLVGSVVTFGVKILNRQVRIETILTGATGSNGLVGDVHHLKKLYGRVSSLETYRRQAES